jgi:hypothetical protein
MAAAPIRTVEKVYSYRSAINHAERSFRLSGDALVWSEGGPEARVPFADMRHVRLYGSPELRNPFLGGRVAPGFERLVVKAKTGPSVVLSTSHFVSLGVWEDRSETFAPFASELIAAVARTNPLARFVAGMPWGVWALWAGAFALSGLGALFGVLVALAPVDSKGSRDIFTSLLGLGMSAGSALACAGTLRVLRRQRPRAFSPAATA